MTVPYTFGTATTSIPLSNLDANFNTPITLGNTSIYLGNTTTTIGNLTLTNATISSGTVNITNVTVTTANVTNITVTGTANIATGNVTTLTSTSITDSGLTSGRVTFAGASGLLSDSAGLTYDGTNLTTTGTATATRFIPSGSTVATNGMFLPAANTLGFSTNSTRQMTISSVGNVGIGVTSPTQTLQLGNATAVEFDSLINGTRTSTLYTDNSQFIIETATNINMIFNTNSTQRMVITGGGNVGIGTSSPAAPLDIGGNPTYQNQMIWSRGVADTDFKAVLTSGDAGTQASIGSIGARYSNFKDFASIQFYRNSAVGNLLFFTGGLSADGTEKMRLDGSGNLGLGVTPSAWTSNFGIKGFNISNGAVYGATSDMNVLFNSYYDGTNFIYSTTAVATKYTQGPSGQHQWFNASSGTAGNTVTFTQAMTLDASGNLSVGTTSAFARLTTSTSAGSAGQVNNQIAMTHASATTGYYISTIRGASTNEPEGLTFKENATERMRIDSSGNVGIGTASPVNSAGYRALTISGTTGGQIFWKETTTSVTAYAGVDSSLAYLGTETNHSLVFRTNNTEKMRLDTSGQLLVGTSSNTTNGGIIFAPDYNGAGISNIIVGHKSTGGNGNQYMIFNYNGTGIGSIAQDSTTGVLYNVTSDQRLKTNIVNAPSGNIDGIKVRSFDWIANGNHQEYGMIAQELIEVAPYAVHKPENPDEMMGVDYSKLVPMMIKEIQDLKAEVSQLKTKIGV